MRSLLKKIVKTINQATKLEWMIQRSATNGKKNMGDYSIEGWGISGNKMA